MSVKAMAWAFEQQIADEEETRSRGKPISDARAKLLLLALADHADDEGRCWPSITRLVVKTSVSRRSIFRKLGVLEATGLISQQKSDGKPTHYILNLSNQHVVPDRCQPGTSATAGTGATGGTPPVPLVALHRTVIEPSIKKEGGLPRAKGGTRKKEPSQPAHRIPADYVLDQAGIEFAQKRGFSGGGLDELFQGFRDHFLGSGAPKVSWAATWRNWVRRQPEFLQRRIGHHGYRGQGSLQDSRSTTAAADRLIEAAERGEFTIAPKPDFVALSEEYSRMLSEERRRRS